MKIPRRRSIKNTRINSQKQNARPAVERLETREVPTITLPTPGIPGPVTMSGTSEVDLFVVRLQSGSPGTIEFSEDGGSSFVQSALADVTSVLTTGQHKSDSLTLDHGNGFIGKLGGLPVTFDGGPGRDQVVIRGNPGVSVAETYTPGATTDAGLLTLSSGAMVQTLNLSRVSEIVDTLLAASLQVSLNSSANYIALDKGKPAGGFGMMKIEGVDLQGLRDGVDGFLDDSPLDDRQLPTGHSFLPISVANKSAVVVDAGGGDDWVVLDNKSTTGLTSLTIDGGTGNDRLLAADSPAGTTLATVSFETTTPDANAIDDRFIQELYVTRLKRVASQGEIDLWRSALVTPGGQTTVVQGIERSREARSRLVRTYYENYLARTPGNGEEQGWVNALLQGGIEESILSGILGSAEFRQRAISLVQAATSDDSFVRALYGVMLGRTPANVEVAGWVAALRSVSSSTVALGFLNSEEYRGRVLHDFYEDMLGRSPDSFGLNAWLGSRLDLSRMREEFELSLEFYDDSKAGATGIQLDAAGQARLQGSSANQNDRQFFRLTIPRNGTLTVNVQSTNGVFADVEIEDNLGLEILETEPKDGINSAIAPVRAGITYSIRVRSSEKVRADYIVDLVLN